MKLNEGGKVFPVGGNVARKAHRNDNPHLDRLHPPQMEELVAQKQVSFLQVILFEIDCAIFYTNLHEMFCQIIILTNWVNLWKIAEFHVKL